VKITHTTQQGAAHRRGIDQNLAARCTRHLHEAEALVHAAELDRQRQGAGSSLAVVGEQPDHASGRVASPAGPGGRGAVTAAFTVPPHFW
jgi:hypothetical protein